MYSEVLIRQAHPEEVEAVEALGWGRGVLLTQECPPWVPEGYPSQEPGPIAYRLAL